MTIKGLIFLTLLTTISACAISMENYRVELLSSGGFRISTENDANVYIDRVEFSGEVISPKSGSQDGGRVQLSGDFALQSDNRWVYENTQTLNPGDDLRYNVTISGRSEPGVQQSILNGLEFHVPEVSAE